MIGKGIYGKDGAFKYFASLTLMLFLLCVKPQLYAQLQTKIDTTEITIGEPIHLEMKIPISSGRNSKWLLVDSAALAPIEIIESSYDTLQNQDKTYLVQRLRLTSFEAGHFVLPSFLVVVEGDTLVTPSHQLFVHDVEVDPNSATAFPIKNIFEEELTLTDYWKEYQWLIITAAAVLMGILLLVGVYFQRKKLREKLSTPLTPYQEAIESLKELDKNNYIKLQQFDPYYSSLSFILRKYLGRVYQFSSLELLTPELVNYLREHSNLDPEEINDLNAFLKDADLVKFAKLLPDENKHLAYRSQVEQWIEKSQSLDFTAENNLNNQ